MHDLPVKLSDFEGPLDLLLSLIEQEEVDIYNIPIHRITAQYLARIETEELDPHSGAEFLLLASELLEMKAKMLLPDHQLRPLIAEGDDPRAELLARLLAYRRVKAAKEILREKSEPERIFSEDFLLELPSPKEDASAGYDPMLLPEAFARALLSRERFHEDAPDSFERFTKSFYSVSTKQREILQLLSYMPIVSFTTLLSEKAAKGEWVASFLALLKLQQDQRVHLSQPERFEEITIEKRSR